MMLLTLSYPSWTNCIFRLEPGKLFIQLIIMLMLYLCLLLIAVHLTVLFLALLRRCHAEKQSYRRVSRSEREATRRHLRRHRPLLCLLHRHQPHDRFDAIDATPRLRNTTGHIAILSRYTRRCTGVGSRLGS